jgi:hypothetical protein
VRASADQAGEPVASLRVRARRERRTDRGREEDGQQGWLTSRTHTAVKGRRKMGSGLAGLRQLGRDFGLRQKARGPLADLGYGVRAQVRG